MLEGKLIADFESFYEATDKASVKFRSFEADGAKVEKRLNSIADSFSGRKFVQEASIVSEAIERIGGVSKLSTGEATSSLRKLEEAMDKMLKTGQQIPTSMMKTAAELRNVTRVTDEADKTVARISENYRKFNGILSSLGINIGPYVKGLEDVAAITGTGAPAVVSFAGAAAAVATALASWKLGRTIGEVSGLTDAIAKGTSALMGWGDVAQEEALAIADSNDLWGKAEANMKRAAEAAAANAKAIQEESDATKENWRITEGNSDAMARLARELEAAKEKRQQDKIAAFQASQAQSIFGEETEQATQAVIRQNVALDARAESLTRIAEAAAEAKASNDAFMNAPTLNDRENAPTTFGVPKLTGFALDDVINDFKQAGDRSSDQALQRALEYLESREGRVAPKNNEQFRQFQRDQTLLAQLRMMLGDRSSFTGQGDTFASSPSSRDEVMVRVPVGGGAGAGSRGMGGLGGNVVNNFYVNGTAKDLVREASAIIINDLESVGLVSRRR